MGNLYTTLKSINPSVNGDDTTKERPTIDTSLEMEHSYDAKRNNEEISGQIPATPKRPNDSISLGEIVPKMEPVEDIQPHTNGTRKLLSKKGSTSIKRTSKRFYSNLIWRVDVDGNILNDSNLGIVLVRDEDEFRIMKRSFVRGNYLKTLARTPEEIKIRRRHRERFPLDYRKRTMSKVSNSLGKAVPNVQAPVENIPKTTNGKQELLVKTGSTCTKETIYLWEIYKDEPIPDESHLGRVQLKDFAAFNRLKRSFVRGNYLKTLAQTPEEIKIRRRHRERFPLGYRKPTMSKVSSSLGRALPNIQAPVENIPKTTNGKQESLVKTDSTCTKETKRPWEMDEDEPIPDESHLGRVQLKDFAAFNRLKRSFVRGNYLKTLPQTREESRRRYRERFPLGYRKPTISKGSNYICKAVPIIQTPVENIPKTTNGTKESLVKTSSTCTKKTNRPFYTNLLRKGTLESFRKRYEPQVSKPVGSAVSDSQKPLEKVQENSNDIHNKIDNFPSSSSKDQGTTIKQKKVKKACDSTESGHLYDAKRNNKKSSGQTPATLKRQNESASLGKSVSDSQEPVAKISKNANRTQESLIDPTKIRKPIPWADLMWKMYGDEPIPNESNLGILRLRDVAAFNKLRRSFIKGNYSKTLTQNQKSSKSDSGIQKELE